MQSIYYLGCTRKISTCDFNKLLKILNLIPVHTKFQDHNSYKYLTIMDRQMDESFKGWTNKLKTTWPFNFFKSMEHMVKPVLSGHSKRIPKLVFKTNYRLMQVKSIAEPSKGSILQYFRPSLSYHLSLRSFFVYF